MAETDKHTIPPLTPAEITAKARGIVTHELMVADLSQHEWEISLGLMMDGLADYSNVGVILVPVGKHIGMHWINNIAPGCTIACEVIPEESLEALQAEMERMSAVLYPESADA